MKTTLARIALVGLGLMVSMGVMACGGGDKTVTVNETPAAPVAPATQTQTPTQTQTTQTSTSGGAGGDCCSGPNGAYAGCSMQTPPNCQ
jgi:hypothetical protein